LNSLYNNVAIGKVCHQLDEVDSTNSYAKELISKSKPSEGTVIIAHHQTGGRGQFGKTWESEPGKNLTFSIILYPSFLPARQAHSLNQAVCLALKDFAESLNIPVHIKWPNDVYHHDKKLAGILIENGVMGENIEYSIIGVGMNVNQTKFSAGLPNPVSLKMIAGKEFSTDELLKKVLISIGIRYSQLKTGGYGEIKDEFEINLYRLREKRHYQAENEIFEGIICGVDDAGQLVIESQGRNRSFSTNGIIYL
jgi:BirA family biotin operon repressor/biotin-[acetyl-CoA-carboxylase] ligase